MTNPIYNELSREQKLLGEIIVQLGNISQAIHIAANSDVDALTNKNYRIRRTYHGSSSHNNCCGN